MVELTKKNRNAIAPAVIAAIVVVVVVIAGAAAYAATSGTKTVTATSTSTAVSTTTATSVSTAVSTSTATTTATSVSTAVSTSVSTTTATSVSTSTAISTVVSTSVSTSTATQTYEPSATINAAGSTLVFPLMSAWTFAYTQVQPNIEVNYASVGSGTGIADITAQTVNIGATDAPPTAAQYAAFPSPVVTIPESISAVVPAYNIPGISNGLKFTGAVLANIYLGNIKTWNDPAIAALNPGVSLPSNAITVIHRSDGSGTMYAFTQYLSDASSQWKTQVGFGTSVNWPTGIGCKGNEGVAGCIENTPYGIGPLEISYALENPTLISVGEVANAAGVYITANDTTISNAVQAGASSGLPAGTAAWSSVSIANAIYNDTAATKAYPITTFTYLVVYQAQTNKQLGIDIVNFLWWVVNDAQNAGVNLGYIPLPANVVTLDDTSINAITYNGASLCGGSC